MVYSFAKQDRSIYRLGIIDIKIWENWVESQTLSLRYTLTIPVRESTVFNIS